MLFRIINFLIVIMILSWCAFLESAESTVPIETLLAAPEQVEINGNKFILVPVLYSMHRQPYVYIFSKIICINKENYPGMINVDKIWLIKNKKDTWEESATLGHESYQKNARAFRVCGPKWEIDNLEDVVVDMIVKIAYGPYRDNKSLLLKASNLKIKRPADTTVDIDTNDNEAIYSYKNNKEGIFYQIGNDSKTKELWKNDFLKISAGDELILFIQQYGPIGWRWEIKAEITNNEIKVKIITTKMSIDEGVMLHELPCKLQAFQSGKYKVFIDSGLLGLDIYYGTIIVE